MPCPAGAGAGRLQEAASDARAVPSPRALERRGLPKGARERGRGRASACLPCALAPDRAPPVLGRIPCRQRRAMGTLGGHDRLAWVVRVLSVCLVPGVDRTMCQGGPLLI